MRDMRETASATARDLGVELIDFRVKQVEFMEDVRNSVYQQMAAERARIATERRATGQEVATQARLCLRDVESLVDIAKGGQKPLTGELHLGVIPTIAPFMLPGVLPKLRRKFPMSSSFPCRTTAPSIRRSIPKR